MKPADSCARTTGRARQLAIGLQVYALLGGVLSLLGWVLDVPRLTDWIATGISIQPNACVAVILASAGTLSILCGRPRWATVLGAGLAALGVATLLEHGAGLDLGIDRLLLFGRTWGETSVVAPGRMGPAGATSWTLIGLGLVLAARPLGVPLRRAAPVLGLIAACAATLSLVGYVYGASPLYTLPHLTAIAMQTATFVLATSIGLVLSVPDHGPMVAIGGAQPGSELVRRMLPVLIVLPIAVGYLRLAGERAGLYDAPFGTALRTLAEIALLSLFALWTGRLVQRQSIRREEAYRALRSSQERLGATVESRERAEAALEHKERQLQHITDSAAVLVAQCSRDLRYVFVNKTCAAFLGRPVDQIVGQRIVDVMGAEGLAAIRPYVERALGGERVEFEVEINYAAAGPRWMRGVYVPDLDEAGQVVGWIASVTDITVRHHAEAALRTSEARLAAELEDSKLLQRLSAELIRDDVRVLYASILDVAMTVMRSQFASMQRVVRTPEGESVLELMSHHGFDGRAAQHWARVDVGHKGVCAAALARGERSLIRDVREAADSIGPPDQELYRELGIRAVQSTPLRSRVGALIGMLSTHWSEPHEPSERDLRLLDIVARQAADLLERRQAEEERESLLERERLARLDAERAGRIKDEFLATLSHELRTPLHAVIGWSQILKRDLSDPEKVRSAVEIIERNGRLQAQLITDLLDISRILSGNMSLDLQPVELSTVVRAAVESITPAAQAKGLELHLDVEPLSEMVQGDPARLQQVVWNLLTNAVKFTPRGGAIRVALSMAGRHAAIRVSDDGRGIEPEFLPHVFERFRQADASAARAYGGLGLGLAIVKQFVELHGGNVRAESDGPDRGATFTVDLPLRPRELEQGILRPLSTSAQRHAPARALQGLRVLLVDDEPDALAMVRHFLEESGARVGAAASVDAALELAALERFDVVVSDIAMPDRDGYALIEELRARGLDLPAAALTAFARPEDRERALGAGFQCHVAKPIEPADLIAAVARLGGNPPLVMSEGV